MAFIKNVAIVGAAGSLGSVIFQKLVDAGFTVRALRRLGSKSTFPPGTDVADIDYTSSANLEAALAGQDAVVAVLNSSFDDQLPLIDAAIAAGVQRFIPSGFGSDFNNPKTAGLPFISNKLAAQHRLEEVAATSSLTWTDVLCNAFLDWGLKTDFILRLSDYKPLLVDGGDYPFSSTTLATIGDAVVGVFRNLEATKNRAVYVHDIVTTQRKLLALAQQVAPEKPWAPKVVKLSELVAQAQERLSKGQMGPATFVPFLYQAGLEPGYGGNFEKVDNELLGLKGKTEEDILEIMKKVIR